MKFRIDWLPLVDLDPLRDEDQQRWSHGTVTVDGEEARDRELLAHEADYGPELVFRACPLPGLEEEHHYCTSCGGDFRERLGTPTSCDCPIAIAGPSIRWIRPVSGGEEQAS